MALNPILATAAVNAEADAVTALLDNGKLQIYDDTAPGQPATADTAITFQVLLAEIGFETPTPFDPAVDGVAAIPNPITDTDADVTGTATWFRCLKSDNTPIFDGTVGVGGAYNLVLNSVAIQQHAAVTVTSFSFTAPKHA